MASGIGRPARAAAASRVRAVAAGRHDERRCRRRAESGDRGLRLRQVAVHDPPGPARPVQDRVRDRRGDVPAALRVGEPGGARIDDDQGRRRVVGIGGRLVAVGRHRGPIVADRGPALEDVDGRIR